MIELVECSHDEDNRCYGFPVTLRGHYPDNAAGVGVTAYVTATGLHRNIDLKRPKGEYLIQGKEVTKYGDHEVDNVQLRGRLAYAPETFQGYGRTDPAYRKYNGPYPYDYIDVVSESPCYGKGDVPKYLLLDYGKTEWYAPYQNFFVWGAAINIVEPFVIKCDGGRFPAVIFLTANLCKDKSQGAGTRWSRRDGYYGYCLLQRGYGYASTYNVGAPSYNPKVQAAKTQQELVDACRELYYSVRSDLISRATSTFKASGEKRMDRYQRFPTSSTWRDPVLAMDEIIPRMRPAIEGLVPWSNAELSSHAADLVQEYNDFSSNLIAYVNDLAKTGDTVREMFKLVGNIKSPKAWASAWLSYRYGDRLFIADTKELLESVSQRIAVRTDRTLARQRIEKANNTPTLSVSRQRTSTLWCFNDSMNDVMTAINNLMRWDAWPTLQNTWDMIPLSFVVDWFLPVQDVLDHLDSAVQAPYIKVESAYVGDKITGSMRLDDGAWLGSVQYTHYMRFKHNSLSDLRPFEADISPSSFGVIQHGDALALLVSSSRHR
jgi:hypothetical protein